MKCSHWPRRTTSIPERSAAAVILTLGLLARGAVGQGCDPRSLFGTHTIATSSEWQFSITSADFNGDEAMDLGVANGVGDDVSVFLGHGDGTFEAEQRYGVGEVPVCVTAADVDGDGVTDIAVANVTSGDVSILLGSGDGTFNPEQRFEAGSGTWSIAAADLNDDGSTDLAATNYISGDVSVFLNNGDGTFAPDLRFALGEIPRGLVISDLDADGKSDIAVANQDSHNVSVLLGNGDGTFQDQLQFDIDGTPQGTQSITASDVDSNGTVDLVVANNSEQDVSVLLGHGDGTFERAQYYGGFGKFDYPQSVIATDLDGNGVVDLATANNSNRVSVLLGYGDGTFGPAYHFEAGKQTGGQAVTASDLDGDGMKDLAVSNQRGYEVSILLNQCSVPVDVQVVDPLQATFRDGDWIADPGVDPVVLAAGGRDVEGYVADGVTPVLARVQLPGPGELTLSLPENETGGVFRGFDKEFLGTDVSPEIWEIEDEYYAFAIISAPEDFVASESDKQVSERQVSLDITWQAEGDADPIELSEQIVVRRPPLMLLHGLWGSWIGTWGEAFKQPLEEIGLDLTPVCYCDPDEAAQSFSANVPKVLEEVSTVLQYERSIHEVAATQADVVGHSMGGSLSRLFIAGAGEDPNFDPEANYDAGYVNRLITLDTPHCGAVTATLLVTDGGAFAPLGPLFDIAGRCITCGAVQDLRPDGVELPDTQGLGVPVHAIVGAGGKDVFDAGSLGYLCIEYGGDPSCLLGTALMQIGNLFELNIFGFEEHDSIVGVVSQMSIIKDAGLSVFGFAPTGNKLGLHGTVPEEGRVGDRVVELLNAAVASEEWVDGFPACPEDGPGQLAVPPMYAGEGGIEIVAPRSGFEIDAGSEVMVVVSDMGEFEIVDGLIVSSVANPELAGEMEVVLLVPADATGELSIRAAAKNSRGEMAISDAVSGDILVPADLVEVEIVQPTIVLTEQAPSEQIELLGSYSDGIDRIVPIDDDVSWSIDDDDIASVSAAGLVSSNQVGNTTLSVAVATDEGTLTDDVDVIVSEVPCVADYNDDGELNVLDFVAFQKGWAAEEPPADCDDSGGYDVLDFVCFQELFQAGCD